MAAVHPSFIGSINNEKALTANRWGHVKLSFPDSLPFVDRIPRAKLLSFAFFVNRRDGIAVRLTENVEFNLASSRDMQLNDALFEDCAIVGSIVSLRVIVMDENRVTLAVGSLKTAFSSDSTNAEDIWILSNLTPSNVSLSVVVSDSSHAAIPFTCTLTAYLPAPFTSKYTPAVTVSEHIARTVLPNESVMMPPVHDLVQIELSPRNVLAALQGSDFPIPADLSVSAVVVDKRGVALDQFTSTPVLFLSSGAVARHSGLGPTSDDPSSVFISLPVSGESLADGMEQQPHVLFTLSTSDSRFLASLAGQGGAGVSGTVGGLRTFAHAFITLHAAAGLLRATGLYELQVYLGTPPPVLQTPPTLPTGQDPARVDLTVPCAKRYGSDVNEIPAYLACAPVAPWRFYLPLFMNIIVGTMKTDPIQGAPSQPKVGSLITPLHSILYGTSSATPAIVLDSLGANCLDTVDDFEVIRLHAEILDVAASAYRSWDLRKQSNQPRRLAAVHTCLSRVVSAIAGSSVIAAHLSLKKLLSTSSAAPRGLLSSLLDYATIISSTSFATHEDGVRQVRALFASAYLTAVGLSMTNPGSLPTAGGEQKGVVGLGREYWILAVERILVAAEAILRKRTLAKLSDKQTSATGEDYLSEIAFGSILQLISTAAYCVPMDGFVDRVESVIRGAPTAHTTLALLANVFERGLGSGPEGQLAIRLVPRAVEVIEIILPTILEHAASQTTVGVTIGVTVARLLTNICSSGFLSNLSQERDTQYASQVWKLASSLARLSRNVDQTQRSSNVFDAVVSGVGVIVGGLLPSSMEQKDLPSWASFVEAFATPQLMAAFCTDILMLFTSSAERVQVGDEEHFNQVVDTVHPFIVVLVSRILPLISATDEQYAPLWSELVRLSGLLVTVAPSVYPLPEVVDDDINPVIASLQKIIRKEDPQAWRSDNNSLTDWKFVFACVLQFVALEAAGAIPSVARILAHNCGLLVATESDHRIIGLGLQGILACIAAESSFSGRTFGSQQGLFDVAEQTAVYPPPLHEKKEGEVPRFSHPLASIDDIVPLMKGATLSRTLHPAEWMNQQLNKFLTNQFQPWHPRIPTAPNVDHMRSCLTTSLHLARICAYLSPLVLAEPDAIWLNEHRLVIEDCIRRVLQWAKETGDTDRSWAALVQLASLHETCNDYTHAASARLMCLLEQPSAEYVSHVNATVARIFRPPPANEDQLIKTIHNLSLAGDWHAALFVTQRACSHFAASLHHISTSSKELMMSRVQKLQALLVHGAHLSMSFASRISFPPRYFALKFSGSAWPADLQGSLHILSVHGSWSLPDTLHWIRTVLPDCNISSPSSLTFAMTPAFGLSVTPVVSAIEFLERNLVIEAEVAVATSVSPQLKSNPDDDAGDTNSGGADHRQTRKSVSEVVYGEGVDQIFGGYTSDEEDSLLVSPDLKVSPSSAPVDPYGGERWVEALKDNADPFLIWRNTPGTIACEYKRTTDHGKLHGTTLRQLSPLYHATNAFILLDTASQLDISMAKLQFENRYNELFGIVGEDINKEDLTFASEGEALLPDETVLKRILLRTGPLPSPFSLTPAKATAQCALPALAACLEWCQIHSRRLSWLMQLVANSTSGSDEWDDRESTIEYDRVVYGAESSIHSGDGVSPALCTPMCRSMPNGQLQRPERLLHLFTEASDILCPEVEGIVGLHQARTVALDARTRRGQVARVRHMLAKKAWVRARKTETAENPAGPAPTLDTESAAPDALTVAVETAIDGLWKSVKRAVSLHSQWAVSDEERERDAQLQNLFLLHRAALEGPDVDEDV